MIDVVIVTHQSEAVLAGCLASLPAAIAEQALVVDNASTDGTIAVAVQAGVRVLRLPANRGFAAAANAGARETEGELLCFLNPDCRPPHELWEGASRLLADAWRFCAVPSLQEHDGGLCGRQPGYTRVKLLADVLETSYGAAPLVRCLRRLPWHDDARWWWPHGACLFIPRATFAALGGFDERYFLYMEDVDLGRRLARAGGEVREIDATVPHARCQGSTITPGRRRRLLTGGRVAYARRHHGRWFAALLRLAAWPAEPLRAVLGRAG